jgi:anti-sigma B factor antagonist
MSIHQHLEVSDSQGVTLIRFLDRQRVDGLHLIVLWQDLFLMIETEGWKKLVLDFSLVDFLSSAVLGKLIALRKKMTARDGMLKLCCLCPAALEVFAVTKLDGLFGIEKTEAEALAAFGRS